VKYYTIIKARIQKFNYVVALVGATLVFLTMFMTTVDVVGRYFRRPFEGTQEISELALAVMVFLGWAYTQSEKGHIFIDIFFDRLPKWLRNIMDVINPLLGIVLLSLVAWQGITYSMESMVSHMNTDNLRIPVWPFHFTMVVGGITFCLQLVFDVVDACQKCRGK
jgi:TRAP-type C4-dicarboxylate transport system permease small subunit